MVDVSWDKYKIEIGLLLTWNGFAYKLDIPSMDLELVNKFNTIFDTLRHWASYIEMQTLIAYC